MPVGRYSRMISLSLSTRSNGSGSGSGRGCVRSCCFFFFGCVIDQMRRPAHANKTGGWYGGRLFACIDATVTHPLKLSCLICVVSLTMFCFVLDGHGEVREFSPSVQPMVELLVRNLLTVVFVFLQMRANFLVLQYTRKEAFLVRYHQHLDCP